MKVHKLKRAPKELTVIFSYLYTTLTENSTAEVNSTWKDNRKKKKLSYKEMPVCHCYHYPALLSYFFFGHVGPQHPLSRVR